MYVCRTGQIVYFDVDDTLLEWHVCSHSDENAVEVVNNGHTFYKRAIWPNINALKDHSRAGNVVVVWSKGGVEWAKVVIEALCIDKYVDIVLTKPDWYYDDLDAEQWLPKRQFKEK